MTTEIGGYMSSIDQERIDIVWKQAWAAPEAWFMEFDHDSHRNELTSILSQAAKFRDLSMDDLKAAFALIQKREIEEIQRIIARRLECRERRDDLKVFYVYNKADKKLIVLAKNASCARMLAVEARHIQEEKNGRVMVLKPENEAKLRVDGSALGRALRDGFPGPVDQRGKNVVHRVWDKVYTPMTVVDVTKS